VVIRVRSSGAYDLTNAKFQQPRIFEEIAMRALTFAAALLLATNTFSAEPNVKTHRYLIERTFPDGALAGLDAATKAQVNANNASLGVEWEKSYTNDGRTRTYCVYHAPNEQAVYDAAKLSGMNVNKLTEIPDANAAEAATQTLAPGMNRYVVVKKGTKQLNGSANKPASDSGVKWLASYASEDRVTAYLVYAAPSREAVEAMLAVAGIEASAIMEAPEILLPH
jgi:hypothetical protein